MTLLIFSVTAEKELCLGLECINFDLLITEKKTLKINSIKNQID